MNEILLNLKCSVAGQPRRRRTLKVAYREGDWFAIPLSSGGYAVGIVARTTERGKVLFGYFFGPRREAAPRVDELRTLDPTSAATVARFGDLALIRSEWPILGRAADWDRSRWPMPAFVSRDPLSGSVWRNEYRDDDPNVLFHRKQIAETKSESLPRDGVHGADAVAKLLDRLLTEQGDSHTPNGARREG